MGGMPFPKKKWRRSDLGVRTDGVGEGIREEERGELRLGCKINNKFKIKKKKPSRSCDTPWCWRILILSPLIKLRAIRKTTFPHASACMSVAAHACTTYTQKEREKQRKSWSRELMQENRGIKQHVSNPPSVILGIRAQNWGLLSSKLTTGTTSSLRSL